MSDTPRTDSYVAVLIAEGADADSLEHFARDIERELNAAKARIARLEEAGDRLAAFTPSSSDRFGAWMKAKKAKP